MLFLNAVSSMPKGAVNFTATHINPLSKCLIDGREGLCFTVGDRTYAKRSADGRVFLCRWIKARPATKAEVQEMREAGLFGEKHHSYPNGSSYTQEYLRDGRFGKFVSASGRVYFYGQVVEVGRTRGVGRGINLGAQFCSQDQRFVGVSE